MEDSAVFRGLLVCLVVLAALVAALAAGLVSLWGGIKRANRAEAVRRGGFAFVAAVSTMVMLLTVAGLLGGGG